MTPIVKAEAPAAPVRFDNFKPLMSGGTPHVMHADIESVAGQARNVRPDLGELTNTFTKSFMVDEIRIGTSVIEGANPWVVNPDLGVYVHMKLGHYDLMRDPIQVGLLAPPQNAYQAPRYEKLTPIATDAWYNQTHHLSYVRWRPSYPLLMRPGQVFVPTFERPASFGSAAVRVCISLAGRIVDAKLPAQIVAPVPYIFAQALPVSATVPRTELVVYQNLLNGPLYLERLMGVFEANNQEGGNLGANSFVKYDDGATYASRQILKMTDQDRDFLPTDIQLCQILDPHAGNTLPLGCTMERHERLQLTLRSADYTYMRTTIAITGRRAEVL